MFYSLVTLPDTAIASTTEYIGSFVTDLWGIIALAIGIPLAFFVIDIIISLVSENKGDKELARLETGISKLKKGISEQEKFYN